MTRAHSAHQGPCSPVEETPCEQFTQVWEMSSPWCYYQEVRNRAVICIRRSLQKVPEVLLLTEHIVKDNTTPAGHQQDVVCFF